MYILDSGSTLETFAFRVGRIKGGNEFSYPSIENAYETMKL